MAGPAIHHNFQRVLKPQVPHASPLLDFLLPFQPLPVERSLAGVGIHGEISNLKGAQVLEEMAALRISRYGRFSALRTAL